MNKNIIKVLLLAAFALTALGAVMASAASAAPQWLINGTAFNGEETISTKALGTGLVFTLKSTLPGGAPINVGCETVSSVGGAILQKNLDRATKITFGPNCKIDIPATCATATTITTGAVNSEATDLAGVEPLYIKFTPVTQPFAKIILKECAAEGNFNVSGLASCKVAAPTVSAVTKLCAFKESKTLLGSLRFGTNDATLEGVVGFTLSGVNTGKPWSANL
jgi:hypothetical protein